MSSYIGAVALDSGQYLVGSTLFGVCNTPANTADKHIILSSFDQLLNGITVHIKFTLGNSVDSNITLQFYSSDAAGATPNFDAAPVQVSGNCICPQNGVIAFTYEENSANRVWRVNNSVDIVESTTNGNINVNGQNVPIHGLGSAAYTNADTYAPKDNPTFTGAVIVPAVSDSSANGTAATVQYVKERTAGLSGLTGAMHFRDAVSEIPPSGTYEKGDVVLGPNNKEYVYNGTSWIELGDEGSYALKSSTDVITEVASSATVTVGSASGWDAGGQASLNITNGTNTAADLQTDEYTIPNVSQANTPTTASVANGVLTITQGQALQFGNAFDVKSVKTFTANVPAAINFTPNTLPTITITNTDTSKITTHDTTVVVPDNSITP